MHICALGGKTVTCSCVCVCVGLICADHRHDFHLMCVCQVMTVRLLRYHAKWLEAKSYMPAEYAAWTYALLARYVAAAF